MLSRSAGRKCGNTNTKNSWTGIVIRRNNTSLIQTLDFRLQTSDAVKKAARFCGLYPARVAIHLLTASFWRNGPMPLAV